MQSEGCSMSGGLSPALPAEGPLGSLHSPEEKLPLCKDNLNT